MSRLHNALRKLSFPRLHALGLLTGLLAAPLSAQTIGGPPSCPRAPAPAATTQLKLPTGQTVKSACPTAQDARVRDVLVYSPAVEDNMRVRVILPRDHATSSGPWPVLYLLTGHGASYESWSCSSFIRKYVEDANVLVVMPDGSRNYAPCGGTPDNIVSSGSGNPIPGFYSDWVSPSGDGKANGFETFHTAELSALLISHFGAVPFTQQKWAVAGLSMGGLGALDYLARHPDMFATAASYSGLAHSISTYGFAAQNGAMLLAGQDTNALWGPYPGTPLSWVQTSHWAEHDPTALAGNLIGKPLFISTGDGRPSYLSPNAALELNVLEGGACSMNQDLVNRLKQLNGGALPSSAKFELYEGSHSWQYWDAQLCRSLPGLLSAINVAYAAPLTCNVPRNLRAAGTCAL